MRGVIDEGPVTRLRRESKLLVSAEEAELLALKLSSELGGAPAPKPTWVTSVYFDRRDHPLAERAVRTPEDCLKIRTKEYFPDEVKGDARVVVEVKRERNGLTRKHRDWLPRAELSKALAEGPLARKLARLAGGPIIPTVAVTYERLVYQRNDAWRVTMDRDVRFYEVNATLALQAPRLGPAELGEPCGREMRVVVEVKHLGAALPGWLVELSRAHTARYSKFAHGIAKIQTSRLGGVGG